MSQDFIARVRMDEIDQVSVKGVNGYEDYTEHIASLSKGNSLMVEVTNNLARPVNEMKAWVDWNHDGDFIDGDEEVYASGPLQTQVYSFSISAPQEAYEGITRMRFRLHDTSYGPNQAPCGTANIGEVEDYSINVMKEVNVGTVQNELTGAIKLFPNPASGKIYIELPDNNQTSRIKILNIYGQTVYDGTLEKSVMIDISSFPSGQYYALINGHVARFLKS